MTLSDPFIQSVLEEINSPNVIGVGIVGSYARGQEVKYSVVDYNIFVSKLPESDYERYTLRYSDGKLVSLKYTLYDDELAPLTSLIMTIAVLGGTGKQGKGLAYRWAKARYKILIGSRSSEKAVTAASEIMELLEGSSSVVGTTHFEATQQADVVVLTVPYEAHKDTLENIKDALKGKRVIDVTVPLGKPKNKVQLPSGGSATLDAIAILGDDVQVVAAFQNISPEYFMTDDEVDCEVLVTGSGKEARLEAIKLVEAIDIVVGPLTPADEASLNAGLMYINVHTSFRPGGEIRGQILPDVVGVENSTWGTVKQLFD